MLRAARDGTSGFVPTEAPRRPPLESAYIAVGLDSLRLDTVTAFRLFLPAQEGHAPILYRERGLSFTDEARRRLLEHGVKTLFVEKSAEREYHRYVEENLPAILDDPALDVGVKSDLLYHLAVSLVQGVMEDPRAGDVIPRSRSFVENTCRFLRSERRAFGSLLRVTARDYYTYTHSVNVFVFTVSLAERAGLVEAEVLPRVGEGALLHDIGKSLVDPAITHWPGKLTPEQWEEMRKHPVYGCEILAEQGVTDSVVLDMVRHHHEKRNGKGYPDGIAANDLPAYVRACTLADIFDALTTHRSYKDAFPPFEALRIMKEETETELDPELFRVLVSMLGSA